MLRLTREMTRSGLVFSSSLAVLPTTTLWESSKKTTEGVVRSPSLLGTTSVLPTSLTYAMQEYVVPRSMPKMRFFLSLLVIGRVL